MRRTQPSALPLERLQAWMQAVLLHPGTTEEALAAPAASWIATPDEAVLPSRTLAPADRIGIYRGMVAARFGHGRTIDPGDGTTAWVTPERVARMERDGTTIRIRVSDRAWDDGGAAGAAAPSGAR